MMSQRQAQEIDGGHLHPDNHIRHEKPLNQAEPATFFLNNPQRYPEENRQNEGHRRIDKEVLPAGVLPEAGREEQ